jgi:hypothetical protein
MGVATKGARLAAALVAVTALAACGGDDARYVESPGGSAWRLGSAGVDRDGTVVISGEKQALTVAPGDGGDVPSREFTVPAELQAPSGVHPRGVSVDRDRTAWVLVGDGFLPVRARDGSPHRTWQALQRTSLKADETVSPGSTPDTTRITTAAAVLDDEAVVVAGYSDAGTAQARANVLVHRIDADGRGTLLAGRAWTGSPDRPRPATDTDPGGTAPATDVDLDDVQALQPLTGDRLLVVTAAEAGPAGGELSFFVLEGTALRRLRVDGPLHTGNSLPAVTTSLTADGRVVVNAATASDAGRQPVALSLDPSSGATTVVDRGPRTPGGIGPVLVADADGKGLVVVSPPGAHPDGGDDHAGSVSITSTPAPGDD